MSTHTTIGHNIVSAADLEDEADWVLHHHERWDGEGYPDGLQGEAIPVFARLFAVADTLDALTTRRPYRNASSIEEARAIIEADSGTHFDPDVIAAFRALPDETIAEIARRIG